MPHTGMPGTPCGGGMPCGGGRPTGVVGQEVVPERWWRGLDAAWWWGCRPVVLRLLLACARRSDAPVGRPTAVPGRRAAWTPRVGGRPHGGVGAGGGVRALVAWFRGRVAVPGHPAALPPWSMTMTRRQRRSTSPRSWVVSRVVALYARVETGHGPDSPVRGPPVSIGRRGPGAVAWARVGPGRRRGLGVRVWPAGARTGARPLRMWCARREAEGV